MKLSPEWKFWRAGKATVSHSSGTGSFRLARYFTMTSLVAFAVVAFTLYFLQDMEKEFFRQVQNEQTGFFSRVQKELTQQQNKTARDNLLAAHEASHVDLTRVFANVLWESDFLPFVTRAQRIPVDHCRAIAEDKEPDARRACFAELGGKIMALPGFQALDDKVRAMLKGSFVFKIKVFDLRGITVYSSEHNQIGEDKTGNRGWEIAASGKPASELTHRERFSAFEGMVEHRDLISSYIPGLAPGGEKIVGVFEIYSDVTPLLKQVEATSTMLADVASVNQARTDSAAVENQRKVDSSSDRFLVIVCGLLALLYGVLYLIARNGQRIIDLQTRAREQSVQREQRWYQEKMTALATMAANVAHEVGNPLATISGLAEQIAEQQAKDGCRVCQPLALLEQTGRIAKMTRQIADFATAHRETIEPANVNQLVKAVCDFMGFDRRFQSIRIELRLDEQLPACMVIADYLNETLMNLMQMCVEGGSGQSAAPGRILIETELSGKNALIRMGFDWAVAIDDWLVDSRFESASRHLADMGGRLSWAEQTIEIALEPVARDAAVN